MPVGGHDDPSTSSTDADRIFDEAIAPAVVDAGMDLERVDQAEFGGVLHAPVLERFVLADFVIADITTADANLFYALGLRNAVRPSTTLTIRAGEPPAPFETDVLRPVLYDDGDALEGPPDGVARVRQTLGRRIDELDSGDGSGVVDGALFRLLTAWDAGDIARLKTDVFRDRVHVDDGLRERFELIRSASRDAARRDEALRELDALAADLAPLGGREAGTLVDLLLTRRALGDWDGIIRMYDELPAVLKRQVLVREQLGLAYNRRGAERGEPADRDEALRVLHGVESQQGPSSETCALIGRVHKDMWQDAAESGDEQGAARHLDASIDAYRRGFRADQRDAFPGVNLLTLLEVRGTREALEEKDRLLPVVRYAVERRLEDATPDYWDHATLLELAALENDEQAAQGYGSDTVAAMRESWEGASTAANLRTIASARRRRGIRQPWLEEIVADLDPRGAGPPAG